MKIGILTFTDGTNIGQRLQNYALQTVIERNCKASVFTIVQKKKCEQVKKAIKICINLLLDTKKEVNRWKRNYLFNKFNKANIHFYYKKILYHAKTFDDSFDMFFAGSDQIWNPYSSIVNSNFFLQFCERSRRRTYAPSFSVEKIPEDKIDEYKKYLSEINCLSIREESGARIIKELAGKEAKVVLDPTLLLMKDDYMSIAISYDKKPQKPYILAMFLGKVSEEIISSINKNNKFELIKIDNQTIIGPAEFLDLMNEADYVITDSYHVTVFSIIFHKNFIVVDRDDKGPNMSTRFDTLLNLLDLTNRKWVEGTCKELYKCGIDFKEVDYKLSRYREESLLYLRNELDGICG